MMNRRTPVLASIALAALLGTSACVIQPPASQGTESAVPGDSTAQPEDPTLITVVITPEERKSCSDPEIVERIEAAKASTEEGTESSTLVLPQDLLEASGSWEKAVAQKEKWDGLAPDDRLFNLCIA